MNQKEKKNATTAEMLHHYLDANGIKQSYLAKRIGMGEDTLSRALRGERHLRADELLLCCDALGVSVERLRKLNDLDR